jgi:hypothetical protein
LTTQGRVTGPYTAKLRLSAFGEALVTVAYGLFAIGLVLGWSALFLMGGGLRVRLAQLSWLVLLALIAAFSPDPLAATLGASAGALAHLTLQLGLEGRRA